MKKNKLLGGLLALTVLVSGCTSAPANPSTTPSITPSTSATPSASAGAAGLSFTPGSYEGVGTGYDGELKLTVTVDAASITAIDVTSHNETEGIGAAALPVLVEKVVNGQTLAIDSISGATATSKGFMEAMTDAMGKSGVDMAALTSTAGGETAAKDAVTLDTQVVVVGAGGAGLAAALTAAQNGAKVLVLEKMALPGGASSMAGGGTNATGSKWQKEMGVENDSPETVFMDLMKNGHFSNDAATLWLYANTMGAAFDWLVDENGAAVPYVKEKPESSAEHSVGRNFSPEAGGASVVNALLAKCESEGVEVMLETPAQELITENGKVVGVKALGADGTPYTINAEKVIIATGGFGANTDMLTESVKKYPYAGAVGATGDGLNMATAIGAGTLNMDKVNIQPHSITLPSGRGQHTFQGCLAMYGGTGTILVSDQGVRFTNERGNADSIKQAMLKNEHSYLIMDATSYETYIATCIASRNFTQEQADEWLAANGSMTPVFATGATLAELGSVINVPGDALSASVEKYNASVAAGEDAEFGRKVSAPMAGEGPYYAVEMNLRYYATLGGLHINDNMQVLNEQGAPIEGLYAAGEVVGGALGDIYAPGALFGWAMTSGHNAGLAVAAK